MSRNTNKHFDNLRKLIHWLLFILIIGQFYLIWCNKNSPSFYMMLHKSLGITIFFLGVLFILGYIFNTKPTTFHLQPKWQTFAAKIIHKSLLLLVLILPILGYLLTCSNGKSITLFNLISIPCLMAQNKPLSNQLALSHELLAYLLLTLICVHTLAALFHHFIKKDNILKNMIPFISEK